MDRRQQGRRGGREPNKSFECVTNVSLQQPCARQLKCQRERAENNVVKQQRGRKRKAEKKNEEGSLEEEEKKRRRGGGGVFLEG
ncbi:hypothetical protein PAMA_014243 [Pampus argenteus]